MNIYIVIPAHNEETSIGLTLESLTSQTLLPKQVVVVNDNSTDATQSIIESFVKTHDWISIVNMTSSNKHLPGTKIINAFYKGYDTLDENYDAICKFDADLIFPPNYLEVLSNHFGNDKKTGMAAGYCYIEQNNDWVLESITGKDHIRGALKMYSKQCFQDIGKLKRSMGWDTIDELLAKYHGWKLHLDKTLTGKTFETYWSKLQQDGKILSRRGHVQDAVWFSLDLLVCLENGLEKERFVLFHRLHCWLLQGCY